MRLVLAAAAFLAAAAQSPGCGPAQGDSQSHPALTDGAWDAVCEGRACAEACSDCPAGAPCPLVSGTACDARGRCVQEGSFVCKADQCAGKACGVHCDAYCPYGAPCPAPYICDGNGQCVGAVSGTCPAAASCEGKAPGDACTIDPPCRAETPPCAMPSIVGVCQADGSCLPASGKW
jgi:hypothetical protein